MAYTLQPSNDMDISLENNIFSMSEYTVKHKNNIDKVIVIKYTYKNLIPK